MAVRDGAVLDVAIERPGARDGVGDRLRGRVVAQVQAMAGRFVALPEGEGFLPDSAGGAGLTVGDAVTVVVTRAAMGGKGPRLSARTDQAGPGEVAVLSRGLGAVARLLAWHPGAAVVVDDPVAGGGGAAVVARAWDDALEGAFAELAGPVVSLPGGGRALVCPTPALVAIDLDAGSGAGVRRGKRAAQVGQNRAAIPVVAAAIRQRNLSGAILVDMAGLPARGRVALGPDWAAALGGDPVGPRCLGFTALGFVEISRPRVHPPLHELLAGPHAAGLAGLRSLVRGVTAAPGTALRLRAAPDVVGALLGDAAARADVLRLTGRTLDMVSDPALPGGGWRVEGAGRG